MKSHRPTSKRSVIWRGDLIRTRLFQSAYTDERQDVLPLIDKLGFTAELPVDRLETNRLMIEKMVRHFNEYVQSGTKLPIEEGTSNQPSETTPSFHWAPTLFRSPPWKSRDQEPEPDDISLVDNSSGVPVVPIPFRHLATWPQLRNRLQPLLSRSVVTRKIDEKKLVQALCRCESIAKLPRIVRKRSPEQVHVIADRSDRCIPFFKDQHLIARQLTRELARDQCRFSVGRAPYSLDRSTETLRTQRRSKFFEGLHDDRIEEPDPQSTVLILGDLAVLERHKPQERSIWIQYCRRWRQQGVKIYALVPYAIDQLPRELAELVEPIAWQGNGVEYASDEMRAQLLRAIFVRAYPAMQLEPELLRELRTMVPEALDASLESDLWQHEWLASNHVSGARNDRVDIKEDLHGDFERLDRETKRRVLSTQRRFRQMLGYRTLWQLEFANLTADSREVLDESEQDTAAMRRTLKEYEEYILRDWIPDEKHDQIAWYSRRVTEAASNDTLIARSVDLIKRKFQYSDKSVELIRSDGIGRTLGLTGFIDKLEARLIRPGREVSSVESTGVKLRSTARMIEVHVPELDTTTRREQAFWKSGKKPGWVSDFGTDEYGAWCEFQVPRHDGKGMVTQRMRWIKPGEFMMGSPEEETVRQDDEKQHHVKLTHGYWIADTPVTQELWAAIEKRPKETAFRGDQHPVERVSWEDSQEWLSLLTDQVLGMDATLPTEAQWEYACRAGSSEKYYFGTDTSKLYQYCWFRENSLNRTHAVKGRVPNAWGLWDMLGNVWELCQDWHGDYPNDTVINPTGPDKGTECVIRGGSWFDVAEFLRVASRGSDPKTRRAFNVGFRFVISDESVQLKSPLQSRVTVSVTKPAYQDPFWKSGRKPDWVSDYGTDKYGDWCEFQVPRHDGNGQVTQRMRWIKPGKFMMGSPKNTSDLWIGDETEHEVTLTQGFWIAATPCTQELWLSVAPEGNQITSPDEQHPVYGISWDDCQAWMKKLNDYLPMMNPGLPSEAQWEYTCRAGNAGQYCFGDSESELGDYAWYGSNSGNGSQPVGKLKPNAWGVYDMHGNIWEWCQDWYGIFSPESVIDPIVLEHGILRVTRGGGWNSPARDLRSSCRFRGAPSDRLNFLGFRLLSSAQGAEPSERAMLPVAEQGTELARIGSAEPAYEFLRSVDLDSTGENSPEEEFSSMEFQSYSSIRVVSDQEGYQFDRLEKPAWALDFGSDAFGLYATFEVKPTLKEKITNPMERQSAVRQRMRWIPPGRFMMGSPEGKDYGPGDEYPQHDVIITHGYWMFDTPCTQGLWKVLMGRNPSYFQDKDKYDPERPVEQVSWEDANGFAQKLNERLAKEYPSNKKNAIDGWDRLMLRLPTEAEWEYACRAGTTWDTYQGDLDIRGDANAPLLDSIGWYGGNSGYEYDMKKSSSLERDWLKERQYPEKAGGTRKVAQKTPNAWGLYDMLGNVWEWCQDWYGNYPTELTERMVDPIGPAQGTHRVLRGGCWINPARELRSACRNGNDPGDRSSGLGFRLLSSAHQPSQATESDQEASQGEVASGGRGTRPTTSDEP